MPPASRCARTAAPIRCVRQVNGGLVGGNTSIQPYCPTPAPCNKVHQRGRRLRAGPLDDGPADGQRAACASTGSTPRIPSIHLGPSLLTPNRNYDVPGFKTTRYKDWTPKVAAAYDLFGDGKTALKVNYGKYVLGQALVVGGLAEPARLQRAAHVDPDLGRQQPQLRPRLRSDRTRGQGPTLTGTQNQVDTCNAPVGVERRTSTTTCCDRTSPCRTMPATAGASGRTAGSSRSAAQHELNQGAVGQRRRVLAVVRQLPRDRQHLRHGGRLHAVLDHARLIPPAPASAGGESAAERHQHGDVLQHQPRRGGQQPDRAVEDDVPRQQRLRPLVRVRHRPQRPAAAAGSSSRAA